MRRVALGAYAAAKCPLIYTVLLYSPLKMAASAKVGAVLHVLEEVLNHPARPSPSLPSVACALLLLQEYLLVES